MFTNLHHSHHLPKRGTKPATGEVRVAIAGNIEGMYARQALANGCEDTEATGF